MIEPLPDDQWSEYVRTGRAFSAVALQGGVAGMFAHAQIFNPAGSGIRVRVRVIEAFTVFGFAINQNVRRFDTALAVLGAFAGPENLLGGGPAPGAEIRTESRVVAAGGAFWVLLGPGNTRPDYAPPPRDWSHDLLPGQGVVNVATVGGFVFAGYQWAEVPL